MLHGTVSSTYPDHFSVGAGVTTVARRTDRESLTTVPRPWQLLLAPAILHMKYRIVARGGRIPQPVIFLFLLRLLDVILGFLS